MFKICIHSVVDVITNSSTTIFSYFDGCIEPAKEMIEAFAKCFFSELKADDMFWINVFAENNYIYYEGGDHDIWEEDSEDDPFKGVEDHSEFLDNLIEQITKGEIEKPQWMIDCEERENWSGNTPSNALYIVPKRPEFEAIGKAMMNFITSTESEACQDG